MRIYTKTGDEGSTALFGGKRVSKSDLRIDAYGTIDELNAWMGLVRNQPINDSRGQFLVAIQNNLFVVGSMLAAEPGNSKIKIPVLRASAAADLEEAMDRMDAALPPLRAFVLPGGNHSVSYCHVARTVCRRAERCVVALNQLEPVDPWVLVYLNRLSDYLFVLSRTMAHELRVEETPWKPDID